MLNAQGERELCYVVNVDDIQPIPGADRVELAIIGGWHVMVKKGEFKPGDPAIYFEIDSKVPETEEFAFLAAKHYKIKTQKYFKGTVLSQGLLMSAKDFGWTISCDKDDSSGDEYYIIDNNSNYHYTGGESRFLTKQLGVKYAEASDNIRKSSAGIDPLKAAAAAHKKLFSSFPVRNLMRHSWGRKIIAFIFRGNKKRKSWPAWVQKTDEERIQNMPWILKDTGKWIATEKIDGTSTTFTIKRNHFPRKNEFYVCSRNVMFNTPDKKCFYDTNVYTEMAEKYHMKAVLEQMLKDFPEAKWITIQGETYGAGIQKRDYSIKEHDFKAFNLIMSSTGRWNTIEMKNLLEKCGIPSVPILNDNLSISTFTVDDLLLYAEGSSVVDGLPREGMVFRSFDGSQSFKAVSNSYLMSYHG